MDLPSKRVFDVLLEKGVTELHHANSVITTCQFVRTRALLSRGTVERRRIFQTSQYTDADDKKFNIWFDVFTDSVDIHEKASRANKYGPVLLVFDVEKLRNVRPGRIWITKSNPTKWENRSDDDRWFRSIKELKDNFNVGDFDQMIVFRHCGGELHFEDALTSIILDDPQLTMKKFQVDIFSAAFGALQLAMGASGLEIPISKRKCRITCKCLENYENDMQKTRELFSPKPL